MCRRGGGCNAEQPKFRVEVTKVWQDYSPEAIRLDGSEQKQELSAEAALQILSRISDEDCRALGLDPKVREALDISCCTRSRDALGCLRGRNLNLDGKIRG